MAFTRYSVRGLPERMGVQLNSRDFDQLVVQEKAKRGEQGRSFADKTKIMAVFARTDTTIAMPPCPMGGRTMHHPLPIALTPREVECVEENEPVRPTRHMDVSRRWR
jgi:hypothetical protein